MWWVISTSSASAAAGVARTASSASDRLQAP